MDGQRDGGTDGWMHGWMDESPSPTTTHRQWDARGRQCSPEHTIIINNS